MIIYIVTSSSTEAEPRVESKVSFILCPRKTLLLKLKKLGAHYSYSADDEN
jgi:hypothetical protein